MARLAGEDRDLLSQIVGRMISISLGGRRLDGEHIINESGTVASTNNWRLIDGRLALKDMDPIRLDTDKLHELREQIDCKPSPEADNKVQEAVEYISRADQIIKSLPPRYQPEIDKVSTMLHEAKSFIGDYIW